jgi:hypothetical protein
MTMIVLLLAFSARASAGFEAEVELGTVHAGDPAFTDVARVSSLRSEGLRVGLDLGDHFAVIGGWHHYGQEVEAYDAGTSARLLYHVDDATLGARAMLPIGDYVAPYASLEGVASFSGAKAVDDSNVKNPEPSRGGGLAPGAVAMIGFEVRDQPYPDQHFWLTAHLEGGYELSTALPMGDQGDVRYGGFAMRGGVGVRF